MPILPVPHIGLAPDPAPQRGDPDTFDDRVDELVEWWETSPEQLNTLVDGVTNNANEAYGAAQDAAEWAALAQSAATGSVAAVDLVATSTSSVVIGTGIKNLVIEPGKQFKPNMPIRLGVTASVGSYMDGYVRTYDPATGALSMQSLQRSGTGTFTAWTLTITGPMNLASFFGGGGTMIWNDLASDGAVDDNPEKLHVASVLSGGALVMPFPGGMIDGYYAYEFYNRPRTVAEGGVSSDLTIKDYTGAPLAFLPPGRATPAHVIGGLASPIFPEASQVGKPLRFAATASARISGSAGAFVRVVTLDATRTMFIVHGTSMHAVVYDASTNTWGSLTLIRSAWGGTGAIDNVMALMIATDTVLVASCPENSTALQMVVLSISGTAITPGTAQTSAAGAASARLLDLIAAGSSYVLIYVDASNNPRMQARTVSGTTVSAPGTEVTGTGGTAAPAVIPGGSTTFAVMTSTTSLMTVRPYTVTGTAIAAGTAATLTVTSISGITLRYNGIRWTVTHIGASGIARAAAISFSGAAVAVSAVTSVASAVTTVTAIQAQQMEYNTQIAVTGTDASGGFVTEFSSLRDPGSGSLSLIGSLIARYSMAAQTVAPAGTDWDGLASSAVASWTISTAKGNEVHNFQSTTVTFTAVRSYRIGPANVATGLPPPSLYPKQVLHNSVVSKPLSLAFSTLGDGTKPALYSGSGTDLSTMRTSPQLINDPVNGAKGTDQGSLWLAYSMGTDANLILEQVRVV
ncbi:hypothetical protein [Duganella sp.]|uniref:hypothetical protein n=1 Tax=Duganella sp. TaxID=1904440 RepID=UPI0031D51B2F